MITFDTEIERFASMGEKTGWSYIFIPASVASQINPGCKKSFRVKGLLDQVPISGLAVIPMGEGDFILALKTSLRKQLKKESGDKLHVQLELDEGFKIEMPAALELCLREEIQCLNNFLAMPKSHQNYYINWFNAAKTEATKVKRLSMIVNAMDRKLNFGQMMRESKA